jgi:hypothetical protein
MYSFLLVFKNLAILYEGACVLSITGLIGLFSLRDFMYALILGAVGLIFSRYLHLFFSIRSNRKDQQHFGNT